MVPGEYKCQQSCQYSVFFHFSPTDFGLCLVRSLQEPVTRYYPGRKGLYVAPRTYSLGLNIEQEPEKGKTAQFIELGLRQSLVSGTILSP
jgi:hypothetical protein